MPRTLWPAVLWAALSCSVEPKPLPSQEAVTLLDRNEQPPLYQLLYETALLPGAEEHQQRVRMLIWLRHMKLTVDQLRRLSELRTIVIDRQSRLERAEAEIALRYAPEENRIYQELWRRLGEGAADDAPELEELRDQLQELNAGGKRERELLQHRLEGVRAILEAEQSFLQTLTPRQEALLTDALFLLRHSLDPVANPGDFRILGGSIYEPGQYGVLARGTTDVSKEPLNIGALWSDEPLGEAHELHRARRDLLLYLALMEPGLDQALPVARKLAKRSIPGLGGLDRSQPPPSAEGAPQGVPAPQPEGTPGGGPAPPPEEPEPVRGKDPIPAAPGAP